MRLPLKFPCLLLTAFLLCGTAMAAEKKAEDHGMNDQMEQKDVKSEGPKDSAGKVTGDGPFFVNIAPFVLPVIGDNGPDQLISIIITLEVEDGKSTDIIKQRLPRLNDAYLQTLYGALDQKLVNKGQLVDIMLVKKRLQAPTDRVLGPGFVKEILVQAVNQRKL